MNVTSFCTIPQRKRRTTENLRAAHGGNWCAGEQALQSMLKWPAARTLEGQSSHVGLHAGVEPTLLS